MTFLVAILFIAVFSLDYLAMKLGVISRFAVIVPEFISMIVIVVIIARGLMLRQWEQPSKYAWWFVAYLMVCLIGIVAETVPPGTVVAGIRNYFSFVPLFFLSAVYPFSQRQVRILLALLVVLILFQVPLAFYQRFVQFAHMMHTGDPVTGSLTTSSALTTMLCIAIAAVMSLYVYGKIGLKLALVAFMILMLPTTINETKATLVLLPAATLGPFILARGVQDRWRKILPVAALCIVGLFVFVSVYNTLIQNRFDGTGISDFFGSGLAESYLYRGVDPGDLEHRVGRFDSIVLPLKIFDSNFFHIFFGLGIGNVSESFLPELSGEYYGVYTEYGVGLTQIGDFIWETGLVGLALYLTFVAMVFFDSYRLSGIDFEQRWSATWWATVTGIIAFALLYKSFFNWVELTFPLYFWAGHFVSRRMIEERERGDNSEAARRDAIKAKFQWDEQAAPTTASFRSAR